MRKLRPHVFLIFALIGFLAVGCAPQNGQADATPVLLPTRIPTQTPEYNDAADAEAIGLTFLALWEDGLYEDMYDLLSPASQQAYSYDSFLNTYQSVNEEIRLESLQTQPLIRRRDNNRIVSLVYNATFVSSLVGSFDDTERVLEVVLDHDTQRWGVAWSPGNLFAELASGASVRLDTVQPRRGNIYDRNGDIIADMNGKIVTVQMVRQEIPDLPACIDTLTQVFDLTADEVTERLNNNNPDWLADVGTIEEATYNTFREPLEANCSASFTGRDVRRYLYSDVYAHILGNVGYPEPNEIPTLEQLGFRQDNILGRSGIEATWDEVLRGTPGGRLTIVTPNGDLLRVLAEQGTRPAESVYLTIDTGLQQFALDRIRQEYDAFSESWGATSDGAAAVALDVNTGEILALVSYPTYDSNAFTPFPIMGREEGQAIVEDVQDDPRDPQLNRAVQGRYPSGSTMKTFTAIAALDSGEYSFEERYYSTGLWSRDIDRVDWLGGGHGSLNLSQALTHSCNSCFYEAGYRLDNVDPYLLPGYFNRVGFGEDPGLDDLVVDPGYIGSPDTKNLFHPEAWTFSDAVDMAIGQGLVEVTPLQMAMAYAQVATDGLHYRPQLVQQVALLDDVSYAMQPELMNTLDIDPEIFDYLQSGLCDVTTASYGTAEFVFSSVPQLMEEYGVCG